MLLLIILIILLVGGGGYGYHGGYGRGSPYGGVGYGLVGVVVLVLLIWLILGHL